MSYNYEDMSISEIIEKFDAEFVKIKKPSYLKVLNELDDCYIEIPGNYIDPDIIIQLLDKCMISRNKLLKIKIEWGRIALRFDQLHDYLFYILKAKISGTAVDKEGKARQLTEKYGREAAKSKEYHDAIKQMLDNIDQAALQLSRMIKIVEQPFVRVPLNRLEGGDSQEEVIDNLKKWGQMKESEED
jgi:hypothetical protein